MEVEVMIMTTPNERLTMRAAELLDEPVTIAVRVHATDDPQRAWGPAGERPQGSVPVLGMPIVPLWRALVRNVRRLVAGGAEGEAVLAFTAAGDRVLLEHERLRPMKPIRELERLGTEPAAVDLVRLAEDLVPDLRIGERWFTVNSADFGRLAKLVAAGELDEPVLATQIRPWQAQREAIAADDPAAINEMLNS